MRVVIMAGGKGSRLAPYTAVFPKPLVPIRDKPILEIVIGQLRDHGFDEVVLAVGHFHHLIRSYFGDGRRLGVRIAYSQEDRPLGTAGPLSLVSQVEEPTLVMNADLLTNLDYGDLYRSHRDGGSRITVGVYRKEVRIDLGVLTTEEPGRVTGYVEKPTLTYDVSMGVYVLDSSIHGLIRERPGQYLDFPDLVNQLLAEREPIRAYQFSGYWLDIGRPADYEHACQEFEHLAKVVPAGDGEHLAAGPHQAVG